MFSAQTFRQKIEFDLSQLDDTNKESLKNTLLNLLYEFRAGPKPMITQLCLALADLAIQMLNWKDPVCDMIDSLHQNPEMVGILLEFLLLLPEEMSFNRKIDIDVFYGDLESHSGPPWT